MERDLNNLLSLLSHSPPPPDSESANGTHLVEDAAHPVKENLEEVALEERQVQVALVKRFGVPPPVPPLAHAAIIPELQRTNGQ